MNVKNANVSQQLLPSIFRAVQKRLFCEYPQDVEGVPYETSVIINQYTLQMLLHKTHLIAIVHYEERKVVNLWYNSR